MNQPHPFDNLKLQVIAEDASYFAGRSHDEAQRSRGGRGMRVAKDARPTGSSGRAAAVAMTGPPRPWSGKEAFHEIVTVRSMKCLVQSC
jgi:hypothetical protein